jgi:hypothetical protein
VGVAVGVSTGAVGAGAGVGAGSGSCANATATTAIRRTTASATERIPSRYTVAAVDAIEIDRAHRDGLRRRAGLNDDAEALMLGQDSLGRAVAAAVGDVAGLDVRHLQCHLAYDAISLVRRGARVTGAVLPALSTSTAHR